MLDLGEFLPLDVDNLPSAVNISPVKPGHDPTMTELWTFIFVQFGVRIAEFFGCACPKRKCRANQ